MIQNTIECSCKICLRLRTDLKAKSEEVEDLKVSLETMEDKALFEYKRAETAEAGIQLSECEED